ncbi:MAG: hypothetical protein IT237_11075 [Bacteroidia bacterium]|nr:hypothetical protein [Bacteroidia bacterium]
MRIFRIIYLLIITDICFGQKDLIGLFGECNSPTSGYLCNQVQFKENNSFVFYDLLHLRGWTLSEGFWKRKGDTIVLNSPQNFYSIKYIASKVSSDSLIIQINDSIEPLAFAGVLINSKSTTLGISGKLTVHKKYLDTIYVFYPSITSGPILIDKLKANTSEKIIINMDANQFGKINFNNEKWLLRGNKLFYSRKVDSSYYDDEKYFIKVKITDLKYNKDY